MENKRKRVVPALRQPRPSSPSSPSSPSTPSTPLPSHQQRNFAHVFPVCGSLSSRRRSSAISFSHPFIFVAFIIICFLPLCSANWYIKEEMVETTADHGQSHRSALDRLAMSGQILVDLSPPPKPLGFAKVADLNRRVVSSVTYSVISSTVSVPSPTVPTVPSGTITTTLSVPVTSTSSTSSSGLATASSTESASPLPSPFDTGFSANITSSCSLFMNGMLANSTFQQCLPISLLLQNSMSFFQAEKSIVRITQTLDASCSANVTRCAKIMASFGSNIDTNDACAGDLSTGNPLIQQAQIGLAAYKTLYTATCIKNQASKSYCFAEAILNATNPSDNYLYFLPLNVSLPGGSQPTCNSCLQSTMAVYEAATSDRSSSVAFNYVSAANQVNVNCGPSFVNASLAAVSFSGAQSSAMSHNIGLTALVIALVSFLM